MVCNDPVKWPCFSIACSALRRCPACLSPGEMSGDHCKAAPPHAAAAPAVLHPDFTALQPHSGR